VSGGTGGSGIVIISYGVQYPPATATTGSPQYGVVNGRRVYTWLSSGSITF
jgi:hypothetical protein